MDHTPLEILYEAGPCLAVFKPAGVLTQAPPGIDSMELRIKTFLRAREGKPGNIYLGVPHRLDRPVSGVLVVARHVRAARRLAEQFEARVVRKLYWAAVEGDVAPAEATWRDTLRKLPGQARAEVVAAEHPEGREAVLRYNVRGRTPRGSWLEIELETGRMHQIRVQCASRGWPIVGDAQYGASTSFGPPSDDPRLRPIALHGVSLAFRHPMTHESVVVSAPLPATWRELELPAAIEP